MTSAALFLIGKRIFMSASLQVGPFALPWGLLVLLLAFLAADQLYTRWARKLGLTVAPHIWLLPLLAVAAARAGFVARYADEYLAQPLSIINIRDGGWEPWAALVVAVVYVWWLWLRKQAVFQPLAGATVLFGVLWLGGNALVQQLSGAAKSLPSVQLVALDAKTHALDQFKGKPVVINLWASWCTPCVREMPALREAQQRYPQVQFLWINQQEKPEVAMAASRGFGLPDAQVLLDPKSEMTEIAGGRALPTTLFYGANGQLQGVRVGELSTVSLNEFMEKIAPAPH